MSNEQILSNISGESKESILATERIYFGQDEVLPAMEAARKDEAEKILKWVEEYSGSLFNWKQLYQIFKTQTNG